MRKYRTEQRPISVKAGRQRYIGAFSVKSGMPARICLTIFQMISPHRSVPVIKTQAFIHPVRTGRKKVKKLSVTNAYRVMISFKLEYRFRKNSFPTRNNTMIPRKIEVVVKEALCEYRMA